jgi:excisionase family DNA binding protein
MTVTSQTSCSVRRLLSIGDAARFLQVSEKTIRRWIAAKTIRAHRVGRQWRITDQELNRLIEEGASIKHSYVR